MRQILGGWLTGMVATVFAVAAGAAPAPADATQAGAETTLFDFTQPLAPERLSGGGATAAVVDGRLAIEFGVAERWPTVTLLPDGALWDLTDHEAVVATIRNDSAQPLRVGLRVDNAGADGQRHCNTEHLNLAPGAGGDLRVTFGKSWGRAGWPLDPAAVTALRFLIDRPEEPRRLSVESIRAVRRRWAVLPDWLGQRPPVDGEWVQTLDQSFTEDTLDQTVWTPRYSWDGPHPQHLQRFSEENVFVEDGNLVILCEKKPGHQYDDPRLATRDYTAGGATTLGKFTQLYGYFEARIKSPTARGLWPAFWMMPDRGEAAGDLGKRRSTHDGGMEIDIWEHLCEWGPGRYNVAVHWDGYGEAHRSWGTSEIRHLPTPDGYHVYGLLWEPGRLVFYCDGQEVAEWANERIATVPLFLKLCVQMGGWATKDIDGEALPQRLLVDHVRVWQRADRRR